MCAVATQNPWAQAYGGIGQHTNTTPFSHTSGLLTRFCGCTLRQLISFWPASAFYLSANSTVTRIVLCITRFQWVLNPGCSVLQRVQACRTTPYFHVLHAPCLRLNVSLDCKLFRHCSTTSHIHISGSCKRPCGACNGGRRMRSVTCSTAHKYQHVTCSRFKNARNARNGVGALQTPMKAHTRHQRLVLLNETHSSVTPCTTSRLPSAPPV